MADSSSSRHHSRPLLPQTSAPLRFSFDDINQRKRTRTKTACEACRLARIKCSGERPKCRSCIDRDIKCHYVANPTETRLQAFKRKYGELQSRRSPYKKFFELLKSVSEQDAQEILARVRSGTDVETLVSHVANGDLLLQLSVVPETRYRYDFPYMSTMPASLLTNDNPYLHSLIYEAATIYPSSRRSEVKIGNSLHENTYIDPSTMSHSQEVDHAMYGNLYLKPFHAAEVIDPRLSQIKPSAWTTVCDDDALMRDLLRVWLHCEYHFTSAVQKDLFLDDMLVQREDFCSSLLVNIVLGYSCVCYQRFTDRAQYWNPHTLTYRFLAEAKRLWELEATKPRITTIQAGMLFNVFYNLSGLDEVGQAYRIQALALAHEMRLFNSTVEGTPRICHGKAFTAWALFNWETLVGFSFMFAPLLSDPPDWSLPDPSEKPEWYGEIWIKYPLSNRLVPLYLGQVFRAKSRFRVIMNEACQTAYSKDSEMTPARAYEYLSRLKSWYDGLSGPLLPRSIALPGHLQLHMYYQHLIITIFEPLLDAETNQTPSPQQIVTDATRYLQTLIRLYYLRHGYEAMDLFIVIPLMLAASDCIEAINERIPASELETLRSTLILAAKGLYSQRRNHYLAEALFRVIRGRMRPPEVALFRGIMNIDAGEEDKQPDMAQAVRSHWPVSVVKKKEDVDFYILTNLVENYAHLNVEGESSGQNILPAKGS